MKTKNLPYCIDCHRRMESAGTCESCKVERQRLARVREAESRSEPDAYRAVKDVLVERYAAVIKAGGRLFERNP